MPRNLRPNACSRSKTSPHLARNGDHRHSTCSIPNTQPLPVNIILRPRKVQDTRMCSHPPSPLPGVNRRRVLRPTHVLPLLSLPLERNPTSSARTQQQARRRLPRSRPEARMERWRGGCTGSDIIRVQSHVVKRGLLSYPVFMSRMKNEMPSLRVLVDPAMF